ncbi:hypothetical protein H0H92_004238 [Tricholoma furcatifolium]|nr:hypothetical protein H0H92_004238 [Tricholoma furcatifolium]
MRLRKGKEKEPPQMPPLAALELSENDIDEQLAEEMTRAVLNTTSDESDLGKAHSALANTTKDYIRDQASGPRYYVVFRSRMTDIFNSWCVAHFSFLYLFLNTIGMLAIIKFKDTPTTVLQAFEPCAKLRMHGLPVCQAYNKSGPPGSSARHIAAFSQMPPQTPTQIRKLQTPASAAHLKAINYGLQNKDLQCPSPTKLCQARDNGRPPLPNVFEVLRFHAPVPCVLRALLFIVLKGIRPGVYQGRRQKVYELGKCGDNRSNKVRYSTIVDLAHDEYGDLFSALSPLSSPPSSRSPSPTALPNVASAAHSPSPSNGALKASVPSSSSNSQKRRNKKQSKMRRKRQRLEDHSNVTETNGIHGKIIFYCRNCQPFRQALTLEDLVGLLSSQGFRLVKWDGKTPKRILDDKGRVIAVCAGQPQSRGWEDAVRLATEQLRRAGELGQFNVEDKNHARGHFPTLSSGFAHGGGRKEPMNQRPSNATNVSLVHDLLATFEPLASFQSSKCGHLMLYNPY